jgi:hypothetical protein
VAHEGFRGADLDRFIKAASHPLAQWVRNNPPAPGEDYVHSVIFGVSERVGPNRNADAYSIKMARADLGTYEKYGRAYRNHRNRVPAEAMGVVKKAYLNEEAGRAEVIVALNRTPEAARRNNGVTADRTLHKLASGSDVAVSQACKVPGDRCSGCGNYARNRSEYCCGPADGGSCKYGGCRDNLGRVFEDGHHLHVDNPSCQFFDWSDVSDTRGADRTAFITGKVANSGRVIGGAELAELMNLVPPDHLLDPAVTAGLRVMRKLAAAARDPLYALLPPVPWDVVVRTRTKLAGAPCAAPVFSGSDHERHRALADLAAGGVVLPPDIWLSAVTGVAPEKCAGAFGPVGFDVDRDLLNRPDVAALLNEYPLNTDGASAGGGYTQHSLAPSVAAQRIEARCAALGATKAARAPTTDPNTAAELRSRYLAYQAAVLACHEDRQILPLLFSDCIGHNR